MQPFFSFQITPMDTDSLRPQVSRALEKRTELVSRQKCPKMWALTDKLNSVEKAPQAVRENRKKRRAFMGLLDWLLGAFLLLPGLMEPRELLIPLLAGAACFGAGTVILWRNSRTLLGIFSLAAGLILGAGALGNRAELGRLLPLGAACILIGSAALLTRNREKQNPFDRAAQQLLAGRGSCADMDAIRISFSSDGMTLGPGADDTGKRTVSYSSFELVLETEDLLLPVFDNAVILMQKKDLLCGTIPQLRDFLSNQVRYVNLSAT